MGLRDLTEGDFEFYRSYSKKMRDTHEKEFLQEIDPALMRAFYRGKNKKESELYDNTASNREHFLTFSRIFQGSNTILPNLYYQNPRVMAQPAQEATAQSAALMTALQNHYMKELNQKQENQEAIMNAWFFGIGWKKQGYRAEFAPRHLEEGDVESTPQGNGMIQSAMRFFGFGQAEKKTPDSNESKETAEIVEWEGPFNASESPMNIMVDHNADLMNRRTILHSVPRSLYDLKIFGNYDEATLKEIFEKMKSERGSRLDDRDIFVKLNELHIKQRNGVWILSWIDEYHKPLRYDPSTSSGKGDGFEPLVFTNEPGVRYPISHMKVATQVQEHVDHLATTNIRLLDNIRNYLIVNQAALAPGMKKAIEQNKLNGIIYANKNISPTDFFELRSHAVSNDLPALMGALAQNVTEIMGSDTQTVAGTSQNRTLGQDQLARVGTQIRESGMLDRVRDWLIRQAYTQGRLLKEYSNAELNIQITGNDYVDQQGIRVEDRWYSFMSEQNPLGAKHYLNGDYDYDINIYDAVKPDSTTNRQQLMELFNITMQPIAQDALLSNNKRFRNDKLVEELVRSFDAIAQPGRFLEDLTAEQKAAIQVQQILKATGGVIGNGQKTPAQAPRPQKPEVSEPV